jgi:glycerol-3-phosphate acyltransferase PlsY
MLQIIEKELKMLPQISDFLIYLIAYVIGSIPSGFLIGLLISNQDIRQKGSGSVGATNLARIYGSKIGFITLIADCSKTFIALFLAATSAQSVYIAAFCVTCGHIFPFWLGFKGGKGVATFFMSLLYLNHYFGIVFCGVWLVMFAICKTSSIASLISVSIVCALVYIIECGQDFAYYVFATSLLVVCAHYDNIKRIIRGREHGFKK